MVIGSNILAGSSGQGGGYNISRSLRLRSSANAYLNRTFGSGGNLRTWTWSAWVKRGALNADQQLFGWWEFGGAYNNQHWIGFTSNNDIEYKLYNGQTNIHIGRKVTTQVFRDPSAWYHLVFVWDTTNATASSRMRIYVNGNQITSFSTSTDPSQNTDGYVNLTSPNALHTLGAVFDSSYSSSPLNVFDGYLTEINFIDGQALTPSSFGETSTTTGVWIPKRYTGTYGTNGFYLPFSDNTSTTTLGADSSGNGNNWTCNNISLTSGSAYDSMTDVPTLTSATAANYCTWNPLDKSSAVSVSNGNLVATNTNVSERAIKGTMQIPSSGKWYFEVIPSGSSQGYFGIASSSAPLDPTSGGAVVGAQSYGWNENGRFYVNGSFSTTPFPTWTSGDVLAIAIDTTANTILFYKNGVAVSAGAQSIDGNYTYFPFAVLYNITWTVNFGQRPFAYTPPTGFVALNTYNLPTPTIGATASSQANKYFDATLYTGTGSAQSIVNSGGFQPALVWAKSRSNAYPNVLSNLIVGATKYLVSNNTDAETTDAGYISAINSNGFSVGTSGGLNVNGGTFVGWQWKGDGTGVTNTAGSITSTVSANTTSGFSVVTYTGTGANSTVGHGLGVAPKMIIIKNRTGVYNWRVWHTALSSTELLYLNTTDAKVTGQTTAWNSTLPSSTVFSLGSSGGVNESASTFVAYCFSEVAGFSKFGSYTGNGSTDGTFVYTGFRPRFILYKNASLAGTGWAMLDSSRNTFNVLNARLFSDSSSAEDTSVSSMDFTSNGFKARSTNDGVNRNGDTIIYMAFAENPFKYSLAR